MSECTNEKRKPEVQKQMKKNTKVMTDQTNVHIAPMYQKRRMITYARSYSYMFTHIHTRTRTHTHAHTYIPIHMHFDENTQTHAHLNLRTITNYSYLLLFADFPFFSFSLFLKCVVLVVLGNNISNNLLVSLLLVLSTTCLSLSRLILSKNGLSNGSGDNLQNAAKYSPSLYLPPTTNIPAPTSAFHSTAFSGNSTLLSSLESLPTILSPSAALNHSLFAASSNAASVHPVDDSMLKLLTNSHELRSLDLSNNR